MDTTEMNSTLPNSEEKDIFDSLSMNMITYLSINCSNRSHSEDSQIMVFGQVTSIMDQSIHLLAFFGNIIALIVLSRRSIGGPRMNQLLMLLTFAECLYTGLSFLSELSRSITFHSLSSVYLDVTCRICSHSSLSLRNWWVVVIGFARYLVISRPLKVKKYRWYSRGGVNIIFSILFIAWACESVGLTYLFRVRVQRCSDTGEVDTQVWVLHNSEFKYRLAEGTAIFFRTFLPVILVSLFSSLTLFHLYRGSSVNRRRLSTATRAIFLLTAAFSLFELPYGLKFIFCIIEPAPSEKTKMYYEGVTGLLVALDSMCNLVIYCISSPAYRRALLNVLFCSGKKHFDSRRSTERSISRPPDEENSQETVSLTEK